MNRHRGSRSADYPGEPEDAQAAGKPAQLDFTLKDMNGVDVHLDVVQGEGHPAELLGDVVRSVSGRDSVTGRASGAVQGRSRRFWALSVDDTAEKLMPYAAEFKMNYPVLVGNGREDVQEAFGPLFGIPVSVIIGRDGIIAKKHSGIATKEQIRAGDQDTALAGWQDTAVV